MDIASKELWGLLQILLILNNSLLKQLPHWVRTGLLVMAGGRRRRLAPGTSRACFHASWRVQYVSNTSIPMFPRFQNDPRRIEVYRAKIPLEGGGAGEGRV